MLFKIVTLVSVSLLSICAAELWTDGFNKALLDEPISSVRFHRDDVPLSYKQTILHKQPASKPLKFATKDHYHQKSTEPINFRSIQYAPLQRPGDMRLHHGNPKMSLHSPHDIKIEDVHASGILPKKPKPIEPRLETEPPVLHPNPVSHLDYTPGHNIEVLRSVNRIPGHNAMYNKIESNIAAAEKQRKLNYLNQYSIYQPNKESAASPKYFLSSTTNEDNATPSTSTTTSALKTKPPTIHYVQHPKAYMKSSEKFPEIPHSLQQQLKKTPYSKMHLLLLNVARAYNMGLIPQKSLRPGANLSVPGKMATILKAQLPEQKTVLHPVKNQHFAFQSKIFNT